MTESFRANRRIEMRIGSGTGSEDSIDLTSIVSQFTWLESMIQGGWRWTVSFQTDDWLQWRDILIGKDDLELYFRLRNFDENTVQSTQWRRAYIDNTDSAFGNKAMATRLTGGDVSLKMRQKHRTRAFRDKLVSQIVSSVALEYDLVPEVTATNAIDDRYQIREDDWNFLRRVTSQAAGQDKRGDFFLWVDNSVLRFGPPQTADRSARQHTMGNEQNRVNNYAISYNGRAVDRSGGASLRAIGYDLNKKTSLVYDVDSSEVSAYTALSRSVPRKQEDGLRIYPVSEESLDITQDCGRAWWGQVGPRYFSLRIETRADLLVRPGSIVEILGRQGPRQDTPLFGRYVILEVKHSIANGAIVTSVTAFRRESAQGPEDSTGAAVGSQSTTDGYQGGGSNNQTVRVNATVIS